MIIREKIQLLGKNVSITCTNGKVIQGCWADRLFGDDANDDERQENSIVIENKPWLTEIYDSEIESIEATK